MVIRWYCLSESLLASHLGPDISSIPGLLSSSRSGSRHREPEVLPEAFNVGLTCGIVDLLPALPVGLFAAAFVWQSAVGFR